MTVPLVNQVPSFLGAAPLLALCLSSAVIETIIALLGEHGHTEIRS